MSQICFLISLDGTRIKYPTMYSITKRLLNSLKKMQKNTLLYIVSYYMYCQLYITALGNKIILVNQMIMSKFTFKTNKYRHKPNCDTDSVTICSKTSSSDDFSLRNGKLHILRISQIIFSKRGSSSWPATRSEHTFRILKTWTRSFIGWMIVKEETTNHISYKMFTCD